MNLKGFTRGVRYFFGVARETLMYPTVIKTNRNPTLFIVAFITGSLKMEWLWIFQVMLFGVCDSNECCDFRRCNGEIFVA